mmetsp:Transcript_8793/g.7765  ORF Transcript_8793/g.7765 Transcript_8793/m.7765 type:complete len:303 (+) Transcript_8793:668-1576(+)
MSSDTVSNLLDEVKGKLGYLPALYHRFENSVGSFYHEEAEKLAVLTIALKQKIEKLEDEFIAKIDSESFDWVDAYKVFSLNQVPGERHYSDPHHLSRWPIFFYLFTAFSCLMCSAVFHLFHCQSEKVFRVLSRLDYAGICFLITGSSVPGLFYGFYCTPMWYELYISILSAVSLVVFIVSLGDTVHKQENILWKSLMYGGLGIFAALPLLHLGYNNLFAEASVGTIEFAPTWPYYVLMGISYLGGLSIYAVKCPERWHPGKFDIWGHSHQLWHLCVLGGIAFQYFAALDHYYRRKLTACVLE